jgi:hypothetical protein
MAGGTWRILVEEGQVSAPTQSTIATKQAATKPKETKKANDSKSNDKRVFNRTAAVVSFSVGIGANAFNQYYSITGQTAKKNRMNATLTYGGIAATAGVQLATANFAGAAMTAIAGGVLLGNQYFNFQKEITEENASAEYLRLRSNTSVNNGKDIFNFSLR